VSPSSFRTDSITRYISGVGLKVIFGYPMNIIVDTFLYTPCQQIIIMARKRKCKFGKYKRGRKKGRCRKHRK
jgi:hypothetical protein